MMGDSNPHLQLHYKAPASAWSEALPIGNGRLGAMIYGGTDTELLQLNEDSVWYGGPQDRTPKNANGNLAKLRQLIRDEKHAEAEALASEAFFAMPKSMRHYEPLGSCAIEYGHRIDDVVDYRRCLDLSISQAVVSYQHNGISYRRDIIASFPNDIILLRHASSQVTRFVVRIDRVGEDEVETNCYLDEVRCEDGRIILHATPGGRDSNRVCLVAGVAGDQTTTVEVSGNCLIVHSSSCLVAIDGRTTYRHADPELAALANINDALSKGWDEISRQHQSDYSNLFGRSNLQMWPDASHVPTNERITDLRDPGLVALYHNYGRYLLISCSRDGFRSLPANLQGIWNPSFAPPWGSKYTININLQMNYWPAGRCGLMDDCAIPLLNLVEKMSSRGKLTAEKIYQCRGWCAHHNTDIWGDTSPQDRWMPATLWPLGGVWLTVDVAEMLHYQYDKDLHERLFPILEGCVQFLLDFLTPSECGQYLVTNPSLSPENTYISDSGKKGIFCEGSTLDMTLVRLAFEQFLWSTETLEEQRSHPLENKTREALRKIPPMIINQQGLIQEWGLKDYGEDEPGHRHVSHLFGLYPCEYISRINSPELAAAANKVLQRRAAHGGGHTGWSRAWLLNLHARLFDADACWRHMDLLLEKSTLPNLLDNHPPFQIDGNFGGCAGILECLIQSTETPRRSSGSGSGESSIVMIRLLPACPAQWSKGKLERVRARNGWLVSFEWVDGQVVEPVDLEATQAPSTARLVFPDGEEVDVVADCPGHHIVHKARRADI